MFIILVENNLLHVVIRYVRTYIDSHFRVIVK
jgi:hypothetical protein